MTRVSCVQRCCAVCARGFDTDEGVEDFKAVLARKVDALPGRIEECTAASESARAARDAVRALGAFLFIHSRAGDCSSNCSSIDGAFGSQAPPPPAARRW